MRPREYQADAIAAIDAAHRKVRSTLAILPTGCGKTVVFAHAAHRASTGGRVLVMAHRTELIRQAAAKIKAVTGQPPEIEKAQSRAIAEASNPMASRYVVASVQTLTSGPKDNRRMFRFDPYDFSLVVTDEAHRGAAASYQEVYSHFGQNPECKFLGVTATGDRADGKGLGVAFDSVAYQMELPDAVRQGWLVPIRQRSVTIEGLDFSKCRVTAGDLNEADIEAAMAFESVLHPVAHATIEVAAGLEQGSLKAVVEAEDRDERLRTLIGNRSLDQTLVFAPSVALGERLADIFCRWLPGSARNVHGETVEKEREETLDGFCRGTFPILVNVGICTEGFDAPNTKNVVMARPTKSRVLATQQVGRGTRPSDAIAAKLGQCDGAAARHALIAGSDKASMLVLDFVGNSGRHKLVSAVDVLAGSECDPRVLDTATQIVQCGEAEDVAEALAMAQDEADLRRDAARREAELRAEEEDRAEAERQAKAAKHAGILATAEYRLEELAGVSADGTAFGQGLSYHQPVASTPGGGATDKQIAFLVKLGVSRETAQSYGKRQAGTVIDKLTAERCTDGQRKYLRQLGYSEADVTTMNFAQASAAIEAKKGVAT